LNFLASGELTINGALNDIRPSGVISLRSGQVNIFTTQFNLARGYPQTATFVPEQGLDPVLNVRLIALVPEASGYRQSTSPNSSEILDNPIAASNFGSLQTIRIQAQIQGPASELNENLELTSSPGRTPSEIVALLGGGFVQTLGRGDSVLGIANLAGSALLTNVQNFIGNALGLSDFRLFTTLVPDDPRRNTRNRNTLGIAAEAGIDITPSLSVSVLKILTANQPAQFGLRYRINDNLILRGSTDFSGDNRAVLEYEARF
jgi:translocation and assembly module TamB